MSRLLDVVADWQQLVDDEQELVVVELDDAVCAGAPWAGFEVQLAVTVALQEPDEQGQPYAEEHEALLRWRAALVQALGDAGRLVATLTGGGAREHVAYVRSAELVHRWRTAPPPGLAGPDVRVAYAPDPQWRGLRELAGLLAEGEEPLRLPE